MESRIKIDQEKCDGCGLCVPACAEEVIKIINGKAKVVNPQHCDGLGACIGVCPNGAITIEAADEHKELVHVQEKEQAQTPSCPSLHHFSPQFKPGIQWPIKLALINPAADYLKNAELALVADCVGFRYSELSQALGESTILAIACPKLDDAEFYIAKLTTIFQKANIKKIKVVHMEVPCCTGLLLIVKQALKGAAVDIPIEQVVINIDGTRRPETAQNQVAIMVPSHHSH